MSGALARERQTRARWFQAAAVAGARLAVVRVVEVAAAASALVWLAELDTGRSAWEERLAGLSPAEAAVGPFTARGCEAHVSSARLRVRLARGDGPWELTVHAPGCALSLRLAAAGAAHEEVAALPRQVAGEDFAQRVVGLAARGSVRLRSEVFAFDPVEAAGANAYVEVADVAVDEPIAWTSAVVLTGHGPRLPVSLVAAGGSPAVVPGFSRRASSLEVVRRGATIAMRHELVAGIFDDLDGAVGLVEARSFA